MSTRFHFADMPAAVQAATVATGFMAWVLFAELVIDRHGLAPYLPLYRVGNLCPYDLAVAGGLLLAWRLARRGSSGRRP